MMCRQCLLLCLLLTVSGAFRSVSAAPPNIEKFLLEGRLAEGAAAMQAAVDANADDRVSQFGLGVTEFFQAVESLGQSQYRFGLLGNRRQAIPFMRLPIPENDKPEQISYESARSMIQKFLTGLGKAEQTLAGVKPSGVKLALKIGQIRLDLDSDGVGTDEESLWSILSALNGGGRPVEAAAAVNQLVVAFDDGDVLWLRGYCHVMSALGEIVLAYDWRDQFERTAHLFYPDVQSPYEFLQTEGTGPFNSFNSQNILDVIALIHTVNYECTEPERMKAALGHLESIISLSRESWKLINAETDDDREWLPNPRQSAALGELRVSQQNLVGWQSFLDEADAILQGKKLLPFWRGIEGGAILFDGSFPEHPELGINVRKIFLEPTRLDLVLWLQGTGLQPVLEKGERTDPEAWRRISDAFNGNFFLFMAWFN
jgi:hypothetical protein